MSKSYKFVIDKWYSEEEVEKVTPIIENFVNFFQKDGVATLQLKSDVSIVVKRDEGLVLHMVLESPDKFTALPKTLTKAREFLHVIITAMAKAVDEQKKKNEAVADMKAKVETEAEDNFLNYISEEKPAETSEAKTETTVKVNGEEVTDPDEKAKVIADINAKKEELHKIADALIGSFTKAFKDCGEENINEWIKTYLDI